MVPAHGGHINKLLGDGLLAVFGGRSVPDHADRALAAAARPARRGGRRSFGERCRIGIGVNSGLVLVGTIGAGDVVELGVVGDPVNVAARVQDATRDLGEPLLVTKATRVPARARRDAAPGAARHRLPCRGKPEPVAVYGARRSP